MNFDKKHHKWDPRDTRRGTTVHHHGPHRTPPPITRVPHHPAMPVVSMPAVPTMGVTAGMYSSPGSFWIQHHGP